MVNGKTSMGTKKKVASNNKMQYLSAYYIFFSCRRKVGTFPTFRSLLLVKYSTKEDVTMLHSIYNFGSGSISIILSSKNYLTFFNIHYLLQPFLSKCSMSLKHVNSFLIPLFKGFFLLVNEPEMYVLTFASGNRHTDEIERKLIKSTESSRNNDWTC